VNTQKRVGGERGEQVEPGGKTQGTSQPQHDKANVIKSKNACGGNPREAENERKEKGDEGTNEKSSPPQQIYNQIFCGHGSSVKWNNRDTKGGISTA